MKLFIFWLEEEANTVSLMHILRSSGVIKARSDSPRFALFI